MATGHHERCSNFVGHWILTHPDGALARIGRSIVETLPPAFLLLILINFGLFWLVLSAVEGQSEQRLQILRAVIEKCLDKRV